MADLGIGEIAAIVGAVTAVGTSAYELSQGTPKAPTAPVAPDTSNAAAQAQAEALLKRRGMASTMLTNPMNPGATASTQRATLGM